MNRNQLKKKRARENKRNIVVGISSSSEDVSIVIDHDEIPELQDPPTDSGEKATIKQAITFDDSDDDVPGYVSV